MLRYEAPGRLAALFSLAEGITTQAKESPDVFSVLEAKNDYVQHVSPYVRRSRLAISRIVTAPGDYNVLGVPWALSPRGPLSADRVGSVIDWHGDSAPFPFEIVLPCDANHREWASHSRSLCPIGGWVWQHHQLRPVYSN